MAVGCLVTALLLITVSMVMGDINIALNRPSKQSSISPHGYCRKRSCGAAQANNGDISINSVTNNNKKGEWWSVDLGDLAEIKNIHLYLSQYPYAWRVGYYSHVVVYTAKQPGKWSVCKDLGKPKTPKVPKGYYLVVECGKPTVARYVKVALLNKKQETKKPLYLAEVKVHGTFVNGISNLALNRRSWQSSVSPWGYCRHRSCDAHQSNDGKISTNSVTNNKNKIQSWSVDLGNAAKINSIHLYLSQYPYAWRVGYYSHVVVYTEKQPGKWSVCKDLGKPKTPKKPMGYYLVVVCDQPTVARFVKVAILNKKPLYLAEVQVYGAYVKDINFALNRPSKQSSTSPYGYCQKRSCGAEQANDGSISTNSVTNSKRNPEWWRVDLGDSIKIKNIHLYLSQYPYAWKKGYYSHVAVYTTKKDGAKESLCRRFRPILKNPEEAKGKYVNVVCSRPTVARYVKVALYGHKPLYLAEVKVYGTFATDHPN